MKRDGIKGKKDSGLFLLYFLAYIIKMVYDIPPTDGHYHEGSYSQGNYTSNDFPFFSILLKFCKGIIDLGLKQALVSNIKFWCESLWRRLDILFFCRCLLRCEFQPGQPHRSQQRQSAGGLQQQQQKSVAAVSGNGQWQRRQSSKAAICSNQQRRSATVESTGVSNYKHLFNVCAWQSHSSSTYCKGREARFGERRYCV